MDCQSCGQSTTQIYSNIRVVQYYCADCDLLYVVHIMPKFHPDRDEKVMVLNAAGNRFTNRDKKDRVQIDDLKTVIPLN